MKRGRNQRRRPQGGNPNRALDSNGPEVRIRGTANQIHDKYLNLARDAQSAGDRIKAESYFQHAEHYFRLIRSLQPAQQPQQQQNQPAQQDSSENEQPSVDGEDNNNNQRGGNSRRNGDDRSRNEDRGRRPEKKAATEDKADSKPEEATAGTDTVAEEEPKKPKRRRAPRKTAKVADSDDESKSKEPQAAE